MSLTDLLKFWKDCRDRRRIQLEFLEESYKAVKYETGNISATQWAWVEEATKKLEHAETMVDHFEKEIDNETYECGYDIVGRPRS